MPHSSIVKTAALFVVAAAFGSAVACSKAAPRPRYDVVISGGTVYDGSGAPGARADVGIIGDEIKAVGDLQGADAATTVRADGLAVAPGFVNMMSGDDSLRVDGRSMSDIKQGVTTEIFGEGDSMGPLTEEMRARRLASQGDLKYPIDVADAPRRHGRSREARRLTELRVVDRRRHAAGVRDRPRGQADRRPSSCKRCATWWSAR